MAKGSKYESAPKKKKGMLSKIIIVLIIGFICGFFAPIRLFRKSHLQTVD